MLFVDDVGDEILSERVGTTHWGYIKKRGTYETRPASTAYVARNEGKKYLHANPFGGSREEVLKTISTIRKNIEIDLEKGIIARWHDESHLNRYYINNPPTLTLSPSYAYPQGRDLKWKPKIMHLKKNQTEMVKERQ